MGWGRGKFPVLSQLNVLTNPGHIEETRAFFVAKYGDKGQDYKLGALCRDWTNDQSPWKEDEDNPHNSNDAGDWYRHCQSKELAAIRADLEKWITDAILAREQIVYRYIRGKSKDWQADRKMDKGKWKITVTGPGF